jgi:transcriptional regulator of acetoin/glycerol metabolism
MPKSTVVAIPHEEQAQMLRRPRPSAWPAAGVVAIPHEEQAQMLAALQQTGFNKGASARLIGMSRSTFWRKLWRNGLASTKPGTRGAARPQEPGEA